MIRLIVTVGNRPPQTVRWLQPLLTIGRATNSNVPIQADNVSGRHGQILLTNTGYVYEDLESTNGSILMRAGEKTLLEGEHSRVSLEVGDRILLASIDNVIEVDAIEQTLAEISDDVDSNSTIVAELQSRTDVVTDALGTDYDALRGIVSLARNLVDAEDAEDVAALCCETCLETFPKATRALFLEPKDHTFAVLKALDCAEDSREQPSSALLSSPQILSRCLSEKKGFIFVLESDRMRAIGTMVASVEELEAGVLVEHDDTAVLACPLFQHGRCYGFIEIAALLTPDDRDVLTLRDLSLANLMSYLVAARLHDIETQQARLKLARKATAGFLSATVGHCFKNLLFVPMSISKMLPMCIEQGRMDEVEWMLSRNLVNIRYLDILSNEFASVSKDPTDSFETMDLKAVLDEAASLVGQVAPGKVGVQVEAADDLPKIYGHPAGLLRMLMNLALNAVDALMGEGGEKLGQIRIQATYDPKGRTVRLVVSDNGPGISEDIQTNMRGIFEQVQNSVDALAELENIAERVRSTKEQGLKEHYGLGFLFVCQTINHHQGSLTLRSEPGLGAEFEITLPLNPTRASEE